MRWLVATVQPLTQSPTVIPLRNRNNTCFEPDHRKIITGSTLQKHKHGPRCSSQANLGILGSHLVCIRICMANYCTPRQTTAWWFYPEIIFPGFSGREPIHQPRTSVLHLFASAASVVTPVVGRPIILTELSQQVLYAALFIAGSWQFDGFYVGFLQEWTFLWNKHELKCC